LIALPFLSVMSAASRTAARARARAHTTALSHPVQSHDTLVGLKGIVARRSMSVARAASCAASNVSSAANAVAGSAASNVSAAATVVVSSASATAGTVASSVSSVASASVGAVAAVATKGSKLLRPNTPKHLPALKDRPTLLERTALQERPAMHVMEKLPPLSLEGTESSRPGLSLHNVGIVRWIFEDAKIRHMARPSYQARQEDLFLPKQKFMPGLILREVCTDVLTSTRNCCNAYRALELTTEGAAKRMQSRHVMQRLRKKVFVASVLGKLLKTVREDNKNAELMWKQCCAGLASWSMNSKAFASRTLGLRSVRQGGSISLGLRRHGRDPTRDEPIAPWSESPARSSNARVHLPALVGAPDLNLQQVDIVS